MKKYICVIVSVFLIFSSLPLCAAAKETPQAVPFSYTVSSEKQAYEKGEEIFITANLKSTALEDITDIRVWLDYPLTDYYITPGVTERFADSMHESAAFRLRVVEDAGVLAFAAKFENLPLIKGFLLRLAHAYKSLTLAYATLRNGLVPLKQNQIALGTVTVMYDNTPIDFTMYCRYSVKHTQQSNATLLSNSEGKAGAEIKAVENAYTGLTFAMDNSGENYGLFVMNPDINKAELYRVTEGEFTLLAAKDIHIKAEESYPLQVLFDGTRVWCYLADNAYDTDPYPVFDMAYSADAAGYGVFCGQEGYRDFAVTPADIPQYSQTYTNPIYDNAPDPFILKDGDTYYLYATTDSTRGFRVSSSTDLVNWQSLGFCAEKGTIFGSSRFWAPEAYHYNGKYYLLYSTDEHIALAVADSPVGPFVKTKDGYLLEDNCIDGHFFFDDDGSVYLYMAYWAESGEEIWGCKMKADFSGIQPDTLTQLTSCREDEGGVNEGPCVLKYEGKYYLTYSVNGYEMHNYAVRLAVSDSPLGTYTGRGTILQKSGSIVGTGHHSFITSPDGSELFIAYHCHYSTTQIHNRRLCIDRCKFVKTDEGYTISVYGPTATAQPYPAS